MSAAVSALKQQLHKIAAEWPGDPFRPNIQLKTFFEHLAEHPNLTPAAVRAARALHEDEFKNKVSLPSLLGCWRMWRTVMGSHRDAPWSMRQ